MCENEHKTKELSIEQIMFLEKYLENFDLEAAADATNTSKETATETLEHPTVKEIVSKEKGFRFRRLSVSNSKTLLHIAEMAYKQTLLADEDPVVRADREQILADLPMKESLKALELLCKYSDVLKNATGFITPGTTDEKITTIEAAADIAKRLVGAVK